MKQKKNDLWKLDLLELKFTGAYPRFPFTKKLLNARNTSHVMKKLPASNAEARQQIEALKTDLFAKKYYGSHKKLERMVSKLVKQQQRTWGASDKSLKKFFADSAHMQELITSKLVKLVLTAILTTKETKTNPPSYILKEVVTTIGDKSALGNPSRFFVKYCQDDKILNGYVSKIWNNKEVKALCDEIEWTFRKIRGNLTKAEKTNRTASKQTSTKKAVESDDDSEDDSEASDSDEEGDSDEESGEEKNIDAEEAFDKFASYDHLVVGSDAESEFVGDLNVNYNEITDEEASESEESGSSSESEDVIPKLKKPAQKEPKPKKEIILPSLATGYFSGGSDDEDDIDNDKVVKAATTVRKNRRGQRARQKIWEQKFGRNANHVQKENQRITSEREQKQMEFEERQRKRDAKAKEAAETPGKSSIGTQKMHPSWEAKKQAEEKMKSVKFAGKKITFD